MVAANPIHCWRTCENICDLHAWAYDNFNVQCVWNGSRTNIICSITRNRPPFVWDGVESSSQRRRQLKYKIVYEREKYLLLRRYARANKFFRFFSQFGGFFFLTTIELLAVLSSTRKQYQRRQWIKFPKRIILLWISYTFTNSVRLTKIFL